MAPDFFEPDLLASDADIAGQPEILTQEPQSSASRPVRRTLFQIVCLEGQSVAKPAS